MDTSFLLRETNEIQVELFLSSKYIFVLFYVADNEVDKIICRYSDSLCDFGN